MVRSLTLITTLLLLLSPFSYGDEIKKSHSGICHDSDSSYYTRVKNFTPYDSLEECLESGGRLPKKAKKSVTRSHNYGAGYSRDKFGHGWDDEDGDCINTRHELLMAQSTSTVETGSNHCTVSRGRWLDPYTGKIFYDAQELDIDHLVPLKWAWDHGADEWTDEKRERFANDPVNLFAVQASENRKKGAKGPLEWMPSDESFHCQYIFRFIRVVETYGLMVSDTEMQAILNLSLHKCAQTYVGETG